MFKRMLIFDYRIAAIGKICLIIDLNSGWIIGLDLQLRFLIEKKHERPYRITSIISRLIMTGSSVIRA